MRLSADERQLRQISETRGLQPAFCERLEWGRWRAMHARIAELHRAEDRGRRGGSGALQSVPVGAVWGWPDWVCLNAAEARPLIVELKSESGKLTGPQQLWLHSWRLAGAEIAVVRPRDVFAWSNAPRQRPNDPVWRRLVDHVSCSAGPLCQKGADCTGWCRALVEAHAAAECADTTLASGRPISRRA